jgi:hypothetical protein
LAASEATVAAPARIESRSRTAFVAGRLLYASLMLVLLMLPFEAGYPPLGRFLWASYTNLEVAIFAMGAAWVFVQAVDGDARRRLLRLPLILPTAALVFAMVLSTLFGEYKALGPQSIFRVLMGALVLVAAWEGLRTARRLIFGVVAIGFSALLSALLGLLEYADWVDISPWLQAFKPQATTVGGFLRLSGSFEYANGAAAYFELVIPVLVGLIFVLGSTSMEGSRWRRGAGQIGLYGTLALCLMALLLTFSRAAWVAIAVAAVVLAAGFWLRRSAMSPRTAYLLRRSALIAVGVMVAALAYVFVTQPLFRLRLTGENDRAWYRNTISPGALPTLYAGTYVTVPVTVRNDGEVAWRAERAPVVHLSYHWREKGSPTYAIFEGLRTALPYDVGPGQSVDLKARLYVPPKPGAYQLEWDMVQEKVAWFYQKSLSRPPLTEHTVLQSPVAIQPEPPPMDAFPNIAVETVENYDTSTVPRMQLWSVAWKMFQANPITGVGPDGFRNLYGQYAGTTVWNRNIYTNSTYVELFTNLGLLGGSLFLWLVGTALWRGVRGVLRGPTTAAWAIHLGATAALAGFMVHGFVDYFLFSTPLYACFWLVMAICLLGEPRREKAQPSGA